jgi:glutamine cyclotransferase
MHSQGLTFYDGFLYEGTGTHGASEIRKVDPANPSIVLQSHLLPTEYFGEGITYYTDREGNHRIIQLTWKEKTGFVYDANTLELIHTFEYQTTTGEGWGISFLEDTCEFVVSDGSHFLLFWDCQSLEEKRKVDVKHYQGHQAHNVNMINELEVIRLRDGRSAVLANVWFEDVILQINPTNGDVDKIYVFDSLHDANKKGNDVFNGISVADENDHSILYVTGKLWPTMYKIKIT